MAQPLYSLGLDYGTNTVRALVVDVADGREIGTGVAPYPHGEAGVVIDERQPLLARQHPADYETALEEAVREALGQCRRDGDFDPARIVGIGLDATASTPLPVDATAAALALDARFASDPDAMAWLWKDHTAHAEAEEITDLARRECPEWLARSGNAYSSEWYFAKLLRLRRAAPQVLEAAAGWVELGDHVVGRLVGCGSPDELRRGVCAAGHKALYHETRGLPPLGFFQQLDGELGRWLEGKLYSRAHASDTAAGRLSASWAARLGLPSGTPVAVAAIDAHIGAVGAGVRPGVLVKILGTSACDMLVHPAAEEALGEIPGI
ncbi:MAG: ribulokinase, partial [Planctomycetota bacterium]|nr:ribulokinase [Planctomycetota bacterium]